MNDYETARDVALRYLDYAPRTGAEVRRRLARDDFSEEVIGAVIADLERAGLLDDARFSRDWVESRQRRKGFGRVRLADELRRKGVDREQIDEAVDTMNEEAEFAAALALARQRLSPAQRHDTGARRRLAAYLQRRGYNWEIIEKVFAQVFANDNG